MLSLDSLRAAIAPLRQTLLEHPIYAAIRTPAALRTFMEHHVFAVWDFMSLLKSLQRALCCVDVPWLPPADAATARLINEIVLGEETDADGRGGYASHFELYRRAMLGFGARVEPIDRQLLHLRRGGAMTPESLAGEVGGLAGRFVGCTFEIIASGDVCRQAAAFTFGREDLLPDVFQKIVAQLDAQTGGGLAEFRFYLKRHIDLDGDEHGPAAERLVRTLCGTDDAKWAAARDGAVRSLEARIELWNGMHDAIVRTG